MLKTLSVLVVTLIIGIVVGWATYSFIYSDQLKNSYVSSLTSGLNYDSKIIESLSDSGNFSRDIQIFYSEKFSSVVLSLKIVRPDYKSLTGIPTQNICKLIEYHEEYGINIDGPIDIAVNEYIEEISPIIRSEISNIQKFTGGKNCEIQGEQGASRVCRYKDPARCENEI
jgi:hypothetical protein